MRRGDGFQKVNAITKSVPLTLLCSLLSSRYLSSQIIPKWRTDGEAQC